MMNFKRTVNLIVLAVLVGSNILTPISYATDYAQVESPHTDAAIENAVDNGYFRGGGEFLH